MRKSKSNFNAIGTFMELSKILEDTNNEVLRLYSEEFARIPYDSKNFRMKLTSPEMMSLVQTKIQDMGAFLKTTPLETMLFIAIYSVETVRLCSVDARDITKFFGISNIDFLVLRKCLSGLLEKGLIRPVERRRRDEEYRITSAAERALFDNKPYKVTKAQPMDRYVFCNTISSLIEDRKQEHIDTRELFKLVEEEEVRQEHLTLVKEMRKLLPDVADRTLFYEICDDFVAGRPRLTSVEVTLGDIYDSMRSCFMIAKSIMNKEHNLQTNDLIELQPAQFLAGAEVSLTEKGRHLLLEEDFDLFASKGGSDKRLVSPDKIPARELFFNEELTEDINFVKNSLQEEAFAELQKRLEANALPKGVAILFHGLPGTGKTAAVDMIAKATGRSVYHVDIAASKTCWFGESEKLFKKIFTDYRKMCETEERKPILLFNEADALFSKRRDVGAGSDNCAQTENSLQNILLEELETLDGILIATTNMCDNFDTAFERRFLFKVQFGQPNTDAKRAIWKSKLSWLTEEECDLLAKKYNMSGGEIDNIVRKSMMEEVLTGNCPTMAMLEAWCRGEKLTRKGGNAIGFAC